MTNQIDIFETTIKTLLLGPGSDVLTRDVNNEIITDFPLKRYYTGILFPEQILKSQGEKDTDNEETDEDASLTEDASDDASKKKDIEDDGKEDMVLSNHFFPSNMGISFCVDKSVNELEVKFSFAIYKQPKQTEISLEISRNAYQNLINDKFGFPFKDIIEYKEIDDDYGNLSLKRKLEGKSKGRTGEYKQFDDWNKGLQKEDFREIVRPSANKFSKLIGTLWQRKPVDIPVSMVLRDANEPQPFRDFENSGYTLKCYEDDFIENRKYIKIQLVNLFEKIPKNNFSNGKELLNESCLFQAEINIQSESGQLREYKPYNENKKHTDSEQQKLEFLYRKVSHFAIGHNCSALWEPLDHPTQVSTTFMPTYDLKSTETKIEGLADIPLHDLSIWGKEQDEVIKMLERFIDKYSDWIKQQNQGNEADTDSGKEIIYNLDTTLKRLKEGVKLLKDGKLFKVFQYTNTAMLLQFCLKGDFYKKIQDCNFKETCPCDNKQKEFAYRPFQLAFLLLSLESSINRQSEHRKNTVDLIWFPTGGGKTEAYLAVAALTIIWRRMTNEHYSGVSVIMRYTLRLLTAQQFERASKLITALEYLRSKFSDDLKEERIFIGLWIGSPSTPNDVKEAIEATKEIAEKGESANQFQIDTCPWCQDKLIKEKNGEYCHAFETRNNSKNIKIKCLNNDCHFFRTGLPIQVVDEVLYKEPPTLLFATVDKFAMLSWQDNGHRFFNSGRDAKGPPDLIIQDELHLLTGPLGSIVGLFETVIEDLCTKGDFSPKIIASTATTRNTEEQVKQLYGNRQVNVFPPSGLTYSDSFFAKQKDSSRRRYLGFMPTGKTGIDSQIHLLVALFIARLKIYLTNESQVNPYWTLVSYYNSLRDVGRMSNKVGDEIQTLIKQVQKRLGLEKHGFNHSGLIGRTEELTSRMDSAKIKQSLTQLEQVFSLSDKNKKGYQYIEQGVVDLVLATNMLSVGIDIDRLNIMQINGMPRNTAEYIQASSRVGRKDKGLVVALFDSNRARDKSYFEHFLSFHQSLYKQIEPLSITPFTENTIDKMIASLMITYVRHKKKLNENGDMKHFTNDCISDFKELLKNRFGESVNLDFCFNRLDELSKDWAEKITRDNPYKFYKGKQNALLSKPDTKSALKDKKWVVAQSMRDIDSSSFIKIQQAFTNDYE
ncbi:helicase-related protein [Candidatus Spongiihabitans sp.]|uniref:helicase-related protein n=1 Tax=Candidatus Spongiihabitans sp. TaxID=3101308 RepID=UPI003C6EFCFA